MIVWRGRRHDNKLKQKMVTEKEVEETEIFSRKEKRMILLGSGLFVGFILCFLMGFVFLALSDNRPPERFEWNDMWRMLTVSVLVVCTGLGLGLVLHGLPFRFDFRQSTVVNSTEKINSFDEVDEE